MAIGNDKTGYIGGLIYFQKDWIEIYLSFTFHYGFSRILSVTLILTSNATLTVFVWDKVFKNEQTKIYGRQSPKNSKFEFVKDFLSQILVGPFSNTFVSCSPYVPFDFQK